MSRLKLIILFIATTALATACTSTVDIDENGSQVLVLNSLVTPDATISASITRTWNHSENRPDVTQDNATVILSVNGQISSLMTFDAESKLYTSTITAHESDIITITASHPDYPSVSGTSEIPEKVEIESMEGRVQKLIDTNHIIVGSDNQTTYGYLYRIFYTLSFNDPAGSDDYYYLALNGTTGGADDDFDLSIDDIFSSNESILDESFSAGNRVPLFRDVSSDGETIHLSFIHNLRTSDPIDKIEEEVTLHHISKDYYTYLMSVHRSHSGRNSVLGNLGLANPVKVYTNINGGVGIMASAAGCSKSIVLETE